VIGGSSPRFFLRCVSCSIVDARMGWSTEIAARVAARVWSCDECGGRAFDVVEIPGQAGDRSQG
jgi:hypothetical protein